MVGGRRLAAACRAWSALPKRARWASVMICGGASSIAPSRYCSSVWRGASHWVSTVSSSSCRATCASGARATKNRVSKRRVLMLGVVGVIQRDQGVSARVCRRKFMAASSSVKPSPARSRARAAFTSTPERAASRLMRESRPRGSASSKPHSSSASRSAATYSALASAAGASASASAPTRCAQAWSRCSAPSRQWSSGSNLPPGKTYTPAMLLARALRRCSSTCRPVSWSRSNTRLAESRGVSMAVKGAACIGRKQKVTVSHGKG